MEQRTAGGQPVLAPGGTDNEPLVAAQGPMRQLSGQLPTWQRDLALYLESGADAGSPPDVRSTRGTLAAGVREAPESAERWAAFLAAEEALLAGCTHPLEAAAAGGRHGVTLLHLYDWATKLVPKRANHRSAAYLTIWLGYARCLGHGSEDDARDTFKMLKNQTFGEKSAALYKEWAAFELSKGNRREAVARLKKGIKMGAEPASLLQEYYQEMQGPLQPAAGEGRATRTPGASTGSLTLSSNDSNTTDMLDASTGTITVTHGLQITARPQETPTMLQTGAREPAEEGVTGHMSPPPKPPAAEAKPPRQPPAEPSGDHTASTTGGLPPPAGVTTGPLTRGLSTSTPGGSAPTNAARPSSNTKPLRRLHGLRGLGGPARRVMAGGGPAEPRAQLDTGALSGTVTAEGTAPIGVASTAEEVAEADGGSGRKRKAAEEAGEPQPATAAPQAPLPAAASAAGSEHPPPPKGRQHPQEQVAPEDGGRQGRGVAQEDMQRETSAGVAIPDGKAQAAPETPAAEQLDDTVQLSGLCVRRFRRRSLRQKPERLPGRSGQHHHRELGKPRRRLCLPISTRNSSPSGRQPRRQRQAAAPPTFAESGAPNGPAQPPRERAAAAKAAAESAAARAPAPVSRPREDDKTVMVKGVRYTKLEVVGRGGSSKVFKVIAPNHQIYALKRIRLHGRDSESASGFVDEIRMLHKLRKKDNIIQLVDAEVAERDKTIYLVLEYGEIDLATMLARKEKLRASGQEELDENFVRLYWQQMLQAVATIHNERIVHSDLKPANFIFVKGQLKLLDFGIAKSMQADTTSIVRENQVGTLNYMSPEAILGGSNNIRGAPPMRVGRASDIWALGCILYQMVHGATPFAPLPFIQKMHAITDTSRPINFPSMENAALQDVLHRCLDRNPATRITMEELLAHAFLHPSKSSPPVPPAAVAEAVAPPAAAGFTKDHLKMMLSAMVVASGGSGSNVDVDDLAESVFLKLSLGEQPDFSSVVSRAIRAADANQPRQLSSSTNTQPGRPAEVAKSSRAGPPTAVPVDKENATPSAGGRRTGQP
eukprot:jgi/Tetstr1/464508/TSEL_009266.t1